MGDSRAEARARRERIRRRRARDRRFAEKAAFHGIRWDSRSHQELYNIIWSANPADMKYRADAWAGLSEGIRRTTDQVDNTMRRLLRTWRGSASDTAAASFASLTRWAGQASDITAGIGAGLDRYTSAVITAQRQMPPPVDGKPFAGGYLANGATTPNSAVMVLTMLGDQRVQDEASKSAKAEAVRVMEQYGQESEEVHGTMPWYDDAPDQPPGPAPTPPGPNPGPDRVPPPDGGSGPGGSGSGVAGDLDGDGIADGTTPEGYSPAASGPGSSSGGPGYGYGAGGGVPGAGGGADVTRGGPGAGGAGGLSGAGPLAARGGAGMAAGRGMAGMGGAGGAGNFFPPLGAGAGAQREEEAEHKNKYDDGLDLFDDLPPAFPPVFGA